MTSFGASEQMVNDNENGLLLAARRIARSLNCCVRVLRRHDLQVTCNSTNNRVATRRRH
jgi:hypothetical protein